MTEEDSVICPDCGHEQEIQVTPAVNVTTDPDMRTKVLSGELFIFKCEKCGFEGFAGFPFIYEDKQTNGGFLIYMEPGCEERVVGIEMPDIADQIVYRDVPMRLVTDVNSLKEKIFIFEAGLDDRVMELFKLLAVTKLDGDPEQKPDELRFSKVEEVDGEKTVIFAAFKEEKYLGVLELPYSLYQSCVITGGPIWDTPLADCTAVDQMWIADRIKEDEKNCEEEHEHCDCGCCDK